MRSFWLGVVLGALVWQLLIEYDDHLTRQFIKREQMTVRPPAKYRPAQPEWMAG